MHTKLLLLLFALFPTLCLAQYTYAPPTQLSDGLQTADLRAFTQDTARFYRLFNQLYTEKNKVHSMLLLKEDQLILEEYFNGSSSDELHDLRSATKSIISLLMGIAIDKGFVASVDDPISTYLKSPVPEKNLDERKEEISIRHLLTMSTGLDCHDRERKTKGQEDKVYRKKDWLQYTLDLPMTSEPGEVSAYCTMGVVLAAEIIQQASGMPLDQFAQTHLFEPLGIEKVEWGHTRKKEVILAGKRLYMRSRDLAKIGLLVLHKGKWQDKQLISEKWIAESTQAHTQLSGMDYGFLWWKFPFKLGEGTTPSTTASGNGGQYIMVLPELDMVAVFTGGAYNSPEAQVAFPIMNRVVIPSLQTER